MVTPPLSDSRQRSEGSQRFFDLLELATGNKPASGYSLLKDRICSLNKRASQKRYSGCHGVHCGGLGVKNVVKNVETKFADDKPVTDQRKNKVIHSNEVCKNETSLDSKVTEIQMPDEVIVKNPSKREINSCSPNNLQNSRVALDKYEERDMNSSMDTTERVNNHNFVKNTPKTPNLTHRQNSMKMSSNEYGRKCEENSSDSSEESACCPCLNKEVNYYYSYSQRKRKKFNYDSDVPLSKAKLRISEDGDEFEEVEIEQLHKYLSLDYADFFSYQDDLKLKETQSLDLMRKNQALLQAIKEDNLAAVEELLDGGADPNFIHDGTDTTVLHTASSMASLRIIQALTAAGANLEARNRNKMTPLHEAAIAGREDIAMHFVLSGVDSNPEDNYGVKPLEFALVHGHISTVQILLKFRADPHLQNSMKETAEAIAKRLGYPPLDLIRDRRNHCTSCASCAKKQAESLPGAIRLVRAIKQENVEVIQKLLKRQVSPNMQLPLALYSPGNGSLLHFAALLGKTDAVKELIVAGANSKVKDIEDKTPLDVAVQAGNDDIANLIEFAAKL